MLHSYLYQDKKLIGATTYIERFYKPFDGELVSLRCANAWLVDQKAVKDLWESNGDLTSGFGTIVHKALEHYNKFREVGARISLKRGVTENYSMPKHPILKSIVEGFDEVNKTEGLVHTEVMLSDVKNGICGQADLILVLDEANKICRVQDYKINVDADEIKSQYKPLAPFDKLPANKITKYQLQLSIYGNMLQKSGWSVTGLDVFVYEGAWKHYELPLLNVI